MFSDWYLNIERKLNVQWMASDGHAAKLSRWALAPFPIQNCPQGIRALRPKYDAKVGHQMT